MKEFLGTLGVPGLAGALTALLWFGTQGGGKAKQLGWGLTLFLSMIAGAAYNAAGTPFNLVSSLVNDGIGMFGDTFPKYSMAGIAVTLAIVIAYKKSTTRQVAVMGIIFWYVATGAGGAAGIVADKIQIIAQNFAS
ncbi:hypothetical protein [Streptomyces murinus]|uniref:hypothetical protein n=1 Tax=Streptomyces murinus TaxID=33900 RepID=UPI0018F51BD7|nr:hypothetical protein [Streptomyces murinus]